MNVLKRLWARIISDFTSLPPDLAESLKTY